MRSASFAVLLILVTACNAFTVIGNVAGKHKHTSRRGSSSFSGKCRSPKSNLQSAFTASNLDSDVIDLDFDWKKISEDVFAEDKRAIILFDGVCNLCNGGVNFALDHDQGGKFRFASLQSKAGQSLLVRAGKRSDDTSSIVLVTPNKTYFKSDAVIRIAGKLGGNPVLPVIGTFGPFVPGFLRNTIYNFVAVNRHRFGEADQCRMDFDNEFGSRFISDDL